MSHVKVNCTNLQTQLWGAVTPNYRFTELSLWNLVGHSCKVCITSSVRCLIIYGCIISYNITKGGLYDLSSVHLLYILILYFL